MQREKFKILLYLKKSGLDKLGASSDNGAYNLRANHRPIQL